MNRKVILVDDDAIILHTAARSLNHRGFECLTFHDAESALEEYYKDPVPVVITDLLMPGMSIILRKRSFDCNSTYALRCI